MRKFLTTLKAKESKQILTLLSGSSIGQIIPLVAAPVLTRIYSPENYGELGLVMAIVSIFSVIATLRYEEAIMLPVEDCDAKNLLIASFILCFLTSSTFLIISSLVPGWISDVFDFPKFQEWVMIIALMIFLSGLFNSLLVWTNRNKRYGRLAIRSIEQSTIGVGSKIILGHSILMSSGLVLGTLVSSLFSTISLLLKTIQDDKKKISSCIKLTKIKKLLQKYQDFPKYNLLHSFIDVINASSVLLIISNSYGLRAVGLYSFAMGILKKPTRLIAQSLSQVYYQKLAEMNANSVSIYRDVSKVFRLSFSVGLIIFVPLYLVSPDLFTYVFGEEWRSAGKVCRVVIPFLFLQFLITPLASVPIIMKEQKKWMLLTLILNTIIPMILLIGSLSDMGFYQSLFVASIVAMLYQIMLLKWIMNIVK